MIGFLRGKLIEKQPPVLLLDVAGVGYQVQASMNTFYRLPEIGQEIQMLTHLIVREDAHLLYGFIDQQERELFCALIKVNGVGPKLALTILSSMAPTEFVTCVTESDTTALVKMPGVGKKTAERLIIEMRDRLTDWQLEVVPTNAEQMVAGSSVNTDIQDAISALVALGYKPQEASRSVKQLATLDLSREELIRLALQKIN